jgi:predicted dehydrogenase
MHPNIEIVALADADASAVTKAGQYLNIKSVYQSYEDLISNHTIDLLCLATRTPERADLIVKAYESGIRAVHAEKPLCNTVRELKMLSSILMRDDFYFTWGAIRRYIPVYQQAVQIVESGEYGNLLEIKVNFGSSPLYWTHAHAFDLLTYGAGKRKLLNISAKFKELEKNENKQLIFEKDPVIKYCIAEFEDDVTGFITQSPGADFILTCEKAEISVISDGWDLVIRHYDKGAYPICTSIPISELDIPCGTLAPLSMLEGCLNGDVTQISRNRKIKEDILLSQYMMFASAYSHIEYGRKVCRSEDLPDLEIWAQTNDRYA